MINNKEDKQIFVTAGGLSKIKKELVELKGTRRKEVAKRIQSARELGDITENSEYDAALEEQAFVEGKISEMEEVLRGAQVINKNEAHGAVIVGSKVRVHLEGGEHDFEIVGELEADPRQNKISHQSPLGQALLGKKSGDFVVVSAPVGKLKYKIVKVY